MAETNWLVGKANFGDERIWPGRHIVQTEWQSGWNDVFPGRNKYDYISDYECIFPYPNPLAMLDEDHQGEWGNLQVVKEQAFGITIENMAHFTQPETANEIMNSGGFIGGMKKINEDKNGAPVRECFSWWSPIFENDTIDTMRQHLMDQLTIFGEDGVDNLQNISAQFASSDAFFPNPRRYGNVYFQCTIDELCDFYKAFIRDDLQYRVLGTFLYKQEIMHAVLVCGEENGDNLFADYPLIPNQGNGNSSGDGNGSDGHPGNVVTRDGDGVWKWYPQATGTEIKRVRRYLENFPKFRRWEHVAFAFHIPQGEIMPVDDLKDRRHEICKEQDEEDEEGEEGPTGPLLGASIALACSIHPFDNYVTNTFSPGSLISISKRC